MNYHLHAVFSLLLLAIPVSSSFGVGKGIPSRDSFTVVDGDGNVVHCAQVKGRYVAGRIKGTKFSPNQTALTALKKRVAEARRSGNQRLASRLHKQWKTKRTLFQAQDEACSSGPGDGGTASMEKLNRSLTREDVRYLLEKAGMGLAPSDERYVALGVNHGIDALVDDFISVHTETDGLMTRVLDRRDGTLGSSTTQSMAGQRQALLDLWLHTGNAFTERLAYFLLSVWTVSGDVISDETFRGAWWDYFERLRSAAAADLYLPDLALDLTRDPLMEVFLSNELNRAGNPNENFARELMELFTLGPTDLDGNPNYTETAPDGSGDIAVAAKMLTGWMVQYDYVHNVLKTQYVAGFHETGTHTMFSGKSYQFSGSSDADLVHGIFDHHPGVSRYYAKEILKEYVTPNPSRSLIESFAAVIREHDFNIRPAMAVLLKSKAFFADEYRDTVAKDPALLAVELIRTLKMHDAVNLSEVDHHVLDMGMNVNTPPSVFWYDPAGWLSPATALEKANALALIFSDTTAQHQPDPDWTIADVLPTGNVSADAVISHVAQLLGIPSLSATQRENLLGYMNTEKQYTGAISSKPFSNTDATTQAKKGKGLIYILSGLPAVQLR